MKHHHQIKTNSRKKVGLKFLHSRAHALFHHPLFFLLTLVGNGFMLLGAITLYLLERDSNPSIKSFLDALWWSVSTVTTVGYGDVSPTSAIGKIAGMIMMIFGTALFSSFTALFATILLEPEIEEVEDEMRQIEKSMRDGHRQDD